MLFSDYVTHIFSADTLKTPFGRITEASNNKTRT